MAAGADKGTFGVLAETHSRPGTSSRSSSVDLVRDVLRVNRLVKKRLDDVAQRTTEVIWFQGLN